LKKTRKVSEVGFIESTKLFADTMKERFIDDNDRSILVFATDGTKAYCATHGNQGRVEQAIYDACIRDEGLRDVIGSAVAHCISEEMRDHIDELSDRLLNDLKELNQLLYGEEDEDDDTE
jgi:hypothetical protein